MLSVLDIFRIGIGPSSSHTVGPMRITRRFLAEADAQGHLPRIERLQVNLQGSLALTGGGHDTPKAVLLGAAGFEPETLDPAEAVRVVAAIRSTKRAGLLGKREIAFDPERDIVFDYAAGPLLHPNAMEILAFDGAGALD